MSLNDVEYYYIRNVQGDLIGLYDKNGAVVVNYIYITISNFAQGSSISNSVGNAVKNKPAPTSSGELQIKR